MTSHLIGQHITGPRQLIELLHSQGDFGTRNEIVQIRLNTQSLCASFTVHDATDLANGVVEDLHAEIDQLIDSEKDPNHTSLISIFTVAHDVENRTQLPAQLVEFVDNFQRQIEVNDDKCLDLLIATPKRWWSAMCTSESCCPSTGRLIKPTETDVVGNSEIANAWQELTHIIDQSTTEESLHKLDRFKELISQYAHNITFRDCILSHLAGQEMSRSVWEKFFAELNQDSQFHSAMVATVLAAISYLNNDLNSAAEKLRVAFERDATYSLAKLLRQGLLSEAPPSLLHSAFTVYSPEQLISKTASGRS